MSDLSGTGEAKDYPRQTGTFLALLALSHGSYSGYERAAQVRGAADHCPALPPQWEGALRQNAVEESARPCHVGRAIELHIGRRPMKVTSKMRIRAARPGGVLAS